LLYLSRFRLIRISEIRTEQPVERINAGIHVIGRDYVLKTIHSQKRHWYSLDSLVFLSRSIQTVRSGRHDIFLDDWIAKMVIFFGRCRKRYLPRAS